MLCFRLLFVVNSAIIHHTPFILRLFSWGISLLCLTVMGACGQTENNAVATAFTQQLERQLALSLEKGSSYHKVVDATAAGEASRTDTLYPSMPMVEFGTDSSRSLVRQDLAYAFAPYARDSALLPFMQIEQAGDTLIAQRIEDIGAQTPLEWQRILADEATGQVYFLESRIRKKSWLYALEVDMTTHFDSLGRYRAHQLRTLTRVPLLGQTFEANITGEMVYP